MPRPAAVIVAGPSVGGEVWARLVAVAVGAAAVAGGPSVGAGGPAEGWWRRSRRGRARVVGAGEPRRPPLDDVADLGAAGEGVVIAVAAGLLAWATAAAVPHLHRGRRQPS